jgi:hypothetical protein
MSFSEIDNFPYLRLRTLARVGYRRSRLPAVRLFAAGRNIALCGTPAAAQFLI